MFLDLKTNNTDVKPDRTEKQEEIFENTNDEYGYQYYEDDDEGKKTNRTTYIQS